MNGAYDTLGNYYALPEHIVADPTNLAEAPSPREVEDDGAKNGEGGGAESEGEDDDEILRRREEKGKAVMVEVIARLSDQSGPDVTVQVGKDDSVRLVTRKVFVAAGVSPLYLSREFQLMIMDSSPNRKRSDSCIWGAHWKENQWKASKRTATSHYLTQDTKKVI